MYKQIANDEAFDIGFIMQIEQIGKANTTDASLQLKCLRTFIKLDRGDAALLCAQNLIKFSPQNLKTVRGVKLF